MKTPKKLYIKFELRHKTWMEVLSRHEEAFDTFMDIIDDERVMMNG